MKRALFGILGSGHGHRLECGHYVYCNGLWYIIYTGGVDPVAGFHPVGLSLDVLRSWLVMNVYSVRQCY